MSSPPASVSRVDLPEPDGPITATSSPAYAANETPRSACTSVAPAPWTRVTSSSCEDGVHRRDLRGRDVGARRGGRPERLAAGRARRPRGAAAPRSGRASGSRPRRRTPASRAPGPRPGRPASGRRSAAALEPGVVLERGHRGRALLLDHGADVDPGHGDGQRQLDRELVARRLGARHRRGEPRGDLVAAGAVTAVDRRGPRRRRRARLDQPVPLQPGQRRVDLPDVERPGARRSAARTPRAAGSRTSAPAPAGPAVPA